MTKTRLLSLVFAGLMIGGANCQARDLCDTEASTLSNRYHATGSASLAASADGAFVVASNTTENSVSLLRTADLSLVQELPVGLEPERIVASGDGFVVSLRGERGLARLSLNGGQLVLDETVATGAEPIGLVADEDGEHLYVAVSQSGFVEQRDAKTMAVIRSIAIDHEPRWLALHPTGKTLYVATGFGGHLHIIDTETGASRAFELPVLNTVDTQNDFRPVPRARRITGDITVRPSGTELLVPLLYVDNINLVDGEGDAPNGGDGGGYGSSGGGKRFEPAVATIRLDKTGAPIDTAPLQTMNVSDNMGMSRESYITSLTAHPTEPIAFATMEASDTVVAIDLRDDEGRCAFGAPSGSDDIGMPPMRDMINGGGSGGAFATARGPVGLVVLPSGQAVVHGRMARSLDIVDISSIDRSEFHTVWNGAVQRIGRELAAAQLSGEVNRGRHLFSSSTTPAMSGHGVNVSCSTCHFDGRNDGLTWPFMAGPRQTPSLAGRVSDTTPVTWASQVDTVAEEVFLTSQGRMGGQGLEQDQADDVAAFVDWRRNVDLPNHGADNAIIDEGRALFHDPVVACARCHSGEAATDAEIYAIRGRRVRTPTLRGIAASAPYFHDGSSPTLRDVLERSRDGEMGNTAGLTSAQLDALEAYLTTR